MRIRFGEPLPPQTEVAVTALWKGGTTHLVRNRARFILLYHGGKCLAEACTLVGMARSTGQRVRGRFKELGPTGLLNPIRTGRPARCGSEQVQFVLGLLETSPRDRGHATNTWTCALLSAELEKEYGVVLTASGMLGLLHREGVRQVRTNHYMARADEEAKRGLCWS